MNLALSRDSKYCTVINRQPASDGIEITMKVSGLLSVRIPDWAGPADAAVAVNGKPVDFSIDGDRVTVNTSVADVVEVTYPQREVETVDLCSSRDYRVSWKGDFVAGIEPRGTVAPLFERDLSAAPTQSGPIDWPKPMPEIEW